MVETKRLETGVSQTHEIGQEQGADSPVVSERERQVEEILEDLIRRVGMPEGAESKRSLNGLSEDNLRVVLRPIAERMYRVVARAEVDDKTGLYRSDAFRESYAESIKNMRPDTISILIVLDVDRFKSINDNLGHSVGDNVLAGIGSAIKRSIRPGDFAGRIGGDEIAIMLTNIITKPAKEASIDDPDFTAVTPDISKIIGRISGEIRKITYGDGKEVAISAGCIVISAEEETKPFFGQAFDYADEALYFVKSKGGNGLALIKGFIEAGDKTDDKVYATYTLQEGKSNDGVRLFYYLANKSGRVSEIVKDMDYARHVVNTKGPLIAWEIIEKAFGDGLGEYLKTNFIWHESRDDYSVKDIAKILFAAYEKEPSARKTEDSRLNDIQS